MLFFKNEQNRFQLAPICHRDFFLFWDLPKTAKLISHLVTESE